MNTVPQFTKPIHLSCAITFKIYKKNIQFEFILNPRMDGDEERKSKQHRASRAGRGHDKKANKSEHSFHSEIDEKRQEKERAGSQKRNPKVLNYSLK